MSDTTTIRVKRETRDRLRSISEQSGAPAAELIDRWAREADENLTLAAAAEAWSRLDESKRDEYRSQTTQLEDFAADLPDY